CLVGAFHTSTGRSEFRLSRKVCGVIRYPSHDELVEAFSGGLLTTSVKVRTSQSLAQYEAAAVRLYLPYGGGNIQLPVTVVEVQPNNTGRSEFWVRLRFDSQCVSLLEAFVMRSDPSSMQAAPIQERRRLKIAVIDDNATQRRLAAQPFRD